jgi:hypothetical protein
LTRGSSLAEFSEVSSVLNIVDDAGRDGVPDVSADIPSFGLSIFGLAGAAAAAIGVDDFNEGTDGNVMEGAFASDRGGDEEVGGRLEDGLTGGRPDGDWGDESFFSSRRTSSMSRMRPAFASFTSPTSR